MALLLNCLYKFVSASCSTLHDEMAQKCRRPWPRRSAAVPQTTFPMSEARRHSQRIIARHNELSDGNVIGTFAAKKVLTWNYPTSMPISTLAPVYLAKWPTKYRATNNHRSLCLFNAASDAPPSNQLCSLNCTQPQFPQMPSLL